jgi:ion channel-forming bestrophin family protein
LDTEEISKIKGHDNVPNRILQMQMKDLDHLLKSDAINAYQQVEISKTLDRLCDSMGASERIKNTVFPSTYSLYIHFFIYFFIIILPFGLVDLFGIIEVPIVVSMAAAFFLIEKTAIHMQDPFENKPTDISVIAISRIIEINIRQMLDEKDLPKKIDPEKYFLM